MVDPTVPRDTLPPPTSPIYPLGDRLKVLPLLPPETYLPAGAIIAPEASAHRDRPKEGLVLAVGRGVLVESTGALVPLECEVGDVVQFGQFAGIAIRDDEIGFDVLLLREGEALGRKRAAELPARVPGDPRHTVVRNFEAEAKARLDDLRAKMQDAGPTTPLSEDKRYQDAIEVIKEYQLGDDGHPRT